ncbi:hypothetical protein [Bradyrhizobium sp. 5.13L]
MTMRQAHAAGDKLLVDHAGDGAPVVIDRLTGERRTAHIFVVLLGASSFTYAQATWTQGLADWISAHVGAFAAIGGVPALLLLEREASLRHDKRLATRLRYARLRQQACLLLQELQAAFAAGQLGFFGDLVHLADSQTGGNPYYAPHMPRQRLRSIQNRFNQTPSRFKSPKFAGSARRMVQETTCMSRNVSPNIGSCFIFGWHYRTMCSS